jgi:predicted TIM-barrel fold metal-dependent hydrolase
MTFELRPEWLGLVQEEILEPERRIVDPHHHFFTETEAFPHYRLEDLWADTGTHNVEQTVFAQCGEHHYQEGPEELRPVGETEWVDSLAAEAARAPAGAARVGAIVGTANVCLGAKVREVLEAHCEASALFRGIRDSAAWDAFEGVHQAASTGNAEMYADLAFREGFAELGKLGLSFDAYNYHTQLALLTDLARAFPDVVIVLDHLGTPLGVGPYEGKRDEIFSIWANKMAELATCPNVNVKLGGMLMPWNGFGCDAADRPPSSDEFVALQARYYHHAIECFGADRCMFESNFPVDKLSISYAVLWNGFKKLAAGYSEDEKDNLFRGTASRVYRLE